MEQLQFEKVVQAIKVLSPAEQRQLRALLDTLLAPTAAPMAEDEYGLSGVLRGTKLLYYQLLMATD